MEKAQINEQDDLMDECACIVSVHQLSPHLLSRLDNTVE